MKKTFKYNDNNILIPQYGLGLTNVKRMIFVCKIIRFMRDSIVLQPQKDDNEAAPGFEDEYDVVEVEVIF